MSYPSLSNYYSSSGQSSNINNAYSNNRPSDSQAYSTSMTGSSSSQSVPYSSSAYGWTGQNEYTDNATANTGNDGYAQSTSYGYPRGSDYDNQERSLNDSYSANYYGRGGMQQTQQPSQNHTDGLTNLAYASGLDSAASTSSAARNTHQQHNSVSSQQQTRVRSPIESQSRYSVNPPSVASYPMQQQASTSSTSSNPLAVNAAAALAGAVNRRHSNQPQPGTSNSTTSPSMANMGSSVSSTPRRTASPQINSLNNPQNSYLSSQQNSHNQYGLSQIPASSSHAQTSFLSNTSRTVNNNTSQIRKSTVAPQGRIQQTGSIANLVSAAHEAESTDYAQPAEAPDQGPTFIDPTRVFDPYHRERQRKKLEEEKVVAESRRIAEEETKATELRRQREKEAEAEAKRKKQEEEAESRQRQLAEKHSAKKHQSKKPAEPSQEEMVAELKAMMDKMKAFQSKDPSLFKRLWDDMRKPGVSAASGPVQSLFTQLRQQSLPASQAPAQQSTPQRDSHQAPESQDKASSNRKKDAQIGADGQQLHLNGYPAVVDDNLEGLPDLGRFPAERRIRPNKYIRKDTNAKDTDNAADATASLGVETSVPFSTPLPVQVFTPSKPASSGKGQVTSAALSGAFASLADGMTNKNGASAKPAAGTVWPLEKRNALASSALRALKMNSENANIPLNEEDLKKMLENNPSYITLCEMLEARGLKFHRGHFARELLSSVPDLKGGAANAQSTPIPGTAVSSVSAGQSQPPAGPVPYPQHVLYHHPLPRAYAPPYPPGGRFVQPPPPPQQYGQPMHFNVYRGPSQPQNFKLPKSKTSFSRPEPPPGSKEAAARKRDFSELIDLTELGDDENYVVPEKHPRLDGPDSDTEMETDPFQAWQRRPPPPPSMAPQFNSLPRGYFPPEPPLQFNPNANAVKKQDPFADLKGQRMVLAQALKKDEGLKKQFYDPKTVARDVLIASGRHPSERPLNVHLAGMLGKYIELDSDVSTFEWDEIDPGGPEIPTVELVDSPATKPRFKIGDRMPRKQKPRLIDKTRLPDKDKRQSSVTATKSTAVQKDTTLSSFKDSSQPQPSFKKPASKLRHSLLASDEHATPAQFDPTRLPQLQSDRSVSKDTLEMADTPVVRKRVGRPPGAKNKYPSLRGLREQANITVNVPMRDPTPASKDKFKCKWKKCSTVLHNLDTLRKHIGRVHRPFSDDTVKEGYSCWWKKCKYLTQNEDGDWVTTKVFEHREDWLKHIEKEHIMPIANKWGDGPVVKDVDPLQLQEQRERYLADANNKQVTPSVSNRAFENNEHHPRDVMNLTETPPSNVILNDRQKAERHAMAAYYRAQGIQKNDIRGASREVLRALRVRKEKVGVGLDKGGCTLINEGMRRILVQNPGVRRIVDIGE